MSPVNKATVTNWNDVMQLNYGVPEINLVSGKGLLVTDSEKKKYLDFPVASPQIFSATHILRLLRRFPRKLQNLAMSAISIATRQV